MRHILFLDFDGVLHASGETRFARMPQFAACIRAMPGVLIVVSSTWREMQGFRAMLDAFPPDVRERIVGATPVLQRARYELGGRQREIEAWLQTHNLRRDNARWLAIDDTEMYFDRDCDFLLLLDGRKAFDAQASQAVLDWYAQGPSDQASQ